MVKEHLKTYRKMHGHKHDELNIPMKTPQQAGLTFTKDLGHGAFGVVKLATDSEGEQKCVKCFKKSDLQLGGVEELKEEFSIMHDWSNERLAKTYEFFQDSTSFYIVNEPYFGGDLTKIRKKCKECGVPMTEDYWRRLFLQALTGLTFLHDKALMHCDIKEDNIMIKTDNYAEPEVVIIDFGIAQHDSEQKMQICGTPGYIPPETWQCQKWYPRGDVFSFGVTMLQLVIDQVPETYEPPAFYPGGPTPPPQQLKFGIFQEGSTPQELARVVATKRAPVERIPGNMAGLRSFIPKLIMKKRTSRINALQALKDPFFSGQDTAFAPYTSMNLQAPQVTSLSRSSMSTPVPPTAASAGMLYKARTAPLSTTSPAMYVQRAPRLIGA